MTISTRISVAMNLRVIYPVAAIGMLVMLGGCLGAQHPVDVAANTPVPVDVMPTPDDADTGRVDPKKVTSLKVGDSILIQTPAEAAAARAAKKAMIDSVGKIASVPGSSATATP